MSVSTVTESRLVWSGRYPDSWPDGLDGWSVSRRELAVRLDRLPLLVVLDPPSFPWPMFTAARRGMPVVVCLPDALDAATIGDLLGGPLLSRLTPYDRLVELRADVRAELEDYWGLTPQVWLPADLTGVHPGGPDDAATDRRPHGWRDVLTEHLAALDADPTLLEQARAGKPRFNQLGLLVAEELLANLQATDPLSDAETDTDEGDGDPPVNRPLVAVGGETAHRWRALRVSAGVSVETLDRMRHDDPECASPDAVVILLRDGGQTSQERLDLLRDAEGWLQPGGVLVVAAHVVTRPDGEPNPSLSQLVEEIHEATGTAVHLQELRSVRWLGESLTRGVVLRFTSLRERQE